MAELELFPRGKTSSGVAPKKKHNSRCGSIVVEVSKNGPEQGHQGRKRKAKAKAPLEHGKEKDWLFGAPQRQHPSVSSLQQSGAENKGANTASVTNLKVGLIQSITEQHNIASVI